MSSRKHTAPVLAKSETEELTRAGFASKYREVAKLRASSPTPKIKALDREAIIEALKLYSSQCASGGETRIGESSQYCHCKDYSTINENIEHERGYPRRGGPYYLTMKIALKTTIFGISGLCTESIRNLEQLTQDQQIFDRAKEKMSRRKANRKKN